MEGHEPLGTLADSGVAESLGGCMNSAKAPCTQATTRARRIANTYRYLPDVSCLELSRRPCADWLMGSWLMSNALGPCSDADS